MTATDPTVRGELLDADDATIEDAVTHADPIVLRGLLYQLTGDEEVARTRVTTVVVGSAEVPAMASEEDLAVLRRKAGDFLKSYRDAGAGDIDIGPQSRLLRSLSLVVGEELAEEDMGFWIEDLALDPWARSLEWRQSPPQERLDGFHVTVIGAAMGGLSAALQLKRAGIPYTVIEKNSGVGGTWFENRYPGARVDTPSRAYTHSFGLVFEQPEPFCTWPENQRYFDWIADSFELRDDIVFDTEVRSLTWDEESSMWEIEMDGPEGWRKSRSNAVITAVGFLNRPSIPEIEGMSDFRERSWHTARWPDDTTVAGTRFAVIGTGCSGYQLVPELALEAEHVVLFQRTAQWLFEMPGYTAQYPPQVNWLDRNLPYYTNFMRFRASLGSRSFGVLSEIDPEFEDDHAVSAPNKRVRDAVVRFLERKLGDPELVAKMTPPHPPFSARPVRADSDYSVLDAIQRDNVTLVTDRIRRINETGIEMEDGTQYDVDAIVFATGFQASEYLYPMSVTGRGGKTLTQLWEDGGARAFVGCMMPGFPNLWSIYGPNTNGGLNVATFHELVTVYALQCIERLILDDMNEIEVKEDAYWRYNELVDERNLRKAWSDPRAHNYYWTGNGRTAVMCPFRGPEMWRFLRYPEFEDLEIS